MLSTNTASDTERARPGNQHRRWRSLGGVVIVTTFAGITSVAMSQMAAAAAVSIWESPFEIDGNTPVTTTGNTDWSAAPDLNVINDQNYTGSATVVADPAGVSCNQTVENIYVNNGKVDDVPQSGTTGQAPDKTDLCQVYIASEERYTNPTTATNPDHPGGVDAYLYLAWHRRTNTGSAVVWWELNQGTAKDVNGFTVRAQGDLLIGFDFQTATPVIYYSKWNAAASEWNLPTSAPSNITVYSDFVDAAVSPNTNFGELAVNMSQLIPGCAVFNSSTTFTQTGNITSFHSSALQDYLGPATLNPPVTTCSPLKIEKIPDAPVVGAGSTIGYTIRVTNDGPVSARGVKLTDALPNDTGLDWSISAGSPFGTAAPLPSCTITGVVGAETLTCGQSTTFAGTPPTTATTADWGYILDPGESVSVHIESPTVWNTALSSPVSNTASVTAWNSNPSTASADIAVEAADTAVTKTDASTTYTPGLPVTYTIVVTNKGPNSGTDITVSDPLPAQLDPASATWTCAATAPNVCDAASGTGGISTTVDLAAGGSAMLSLTATAFSSAQTDLVNTVRVAHASETFLPVGDTRLLDNVAVDTDTILHVSDLAITKTDGSTTFGPGLPVTYTIVATNAGPSDVIDAAIVDPVPAGVTSMTWTCPLCDVTSGTGSIATTADITAGGSVTITAIASTDPAFGGDLVNTATVTPPAGVTDPVTINNSATDTDTPAPTPEADLSITKTDDSTTYVPGGPITYTIVVSNAGPSAVAQALVGDDVPAEILGATWTCASTTGAGTCGFAAGTGDIVDLAVDLAPGASITITVTGIASSSFRTGPLINTASVAPPADVTDPDLTNNIAIDVDNAAPTADLSIVKTGPATYTAGTVMTYAIDVASTGPSTVVDAVVSDMLDATIFDTGAATWSCVAGACEASSGSGSLSTTLTLAAGETATYEIVAKVLATVAVDPLLNTAGILPPADVSDPDPTNNTSTWSSTPAPLADLVIAKTGAASVTAGDSVMFAITVTNNGPSNAQQVVVDDPAPTGLTWISSGEPCSTGFPCSLGTLAAGATVTIPAIVFSVPSDHLAAGATTTTNGATVRSATPDPDATNNTATHTVDVVSVADLSITKTDGRDLYQPGDAITYILVVANAGPSDVVGARVTDPIPSSVADVRWSCAPATSCSVSSGSGDVDVLVDVAVGERVSISATGTVSGSASDVIANTASVAAPAGSVDPLPTNNTATDLTAPGPRSLPATPVPPANVPLPSAPLPSTGSSSTLALLAIGAGLIAVGWAALQVRRWPRPM